jgi:hypothetical protein
MKKYIKIFITFFLISTLIFIYEKEIYADTMDAYFMSESNFNIWGEGVQTTYNDHGYDTVLNVNGSETNIKNGTGSLNGVNLITNLTNISDGNYVKVEYIVTNNNNSSATIGIATHADIQIASNDRAPIDNISGNRGFTMSDGSHIFRFIGRDSYGVTNVDTYWFGTYNDRQANMWNTSYTYDGSNTDSGMAYSWKNRSIGPGETQKYSVIIGVGELNTPPTINVTSSFDKAYYPTQTVKVTGTVNDIDVGDVLTVKYAIDSGAEITIGNNYRPNGNAVPFNTSFVIPTSISTGQHMIQLWAADDKGNMSVPVTVYFNVGSDTTPPDATHQITPSSWTKGNVDIALKVTDSQSGVKNVTLPNGQVVTTTNINFTATNNGNYKFILVDNVGNSRDYIVTINNIDRTVPTITVNPKDSNWVQEIEVKIDILDNQSGVKYYKYAVTDSKDTPTTWSENIASVNGKLTIDTETEKYLHIIAEDNVGNITSDNVTGPYHIDKTAPSISVNPKTSDWARETQVQVSFTDGGAGFKHYKYAITDNKNLPTTWSENIAKANDTITINTETEKYLHIIAEDNVGNITSDNVTGPYLIDRTNPTIQVIGDLQTIVVDELTLDLEANDVPSGVATFKMDGEVIFNGNHTFNKNGKHTLEAVDKAGNTYSTEFEITNIYYECDAGLEHPIYSSTYDSCPICEAYKGLKVTDAADIYNSEKQGVKYENPRNAEIVEYYDGIKENPENVKEYEYELKVVYEGNEYKTGVWGKYTITPKIITIEDIIATNKVYNGNTTVVISGGRLIGVCEGDNLYFELPLTGEAESKNVGQWKVSIAEIKLIGEDAPNYILKHPEYGEIMVTISKETGILVIGCESKKYDRELIEPYVVEKNTTSEVTYKYYKAGTDEEIERPYDIGKYDVVGYAETDGNYTEVESNKVTFEIKKPDPPSIGIESRVVKVNEKTVTIEEQPAPMQYGDIVTIQIRIKNNGLGSGYAKEVTSTIADGMEYIEDNEINKANGWKLDGKKVTTSKYSYETDINNELYPKRYEYEENEDYSDIKNTITNEDKKEKSNDETLLEKENPTNEGKRKVEEGGETETGKTEDTEEKEEEKPELNTGVQKLQLVLKVTKNDKTHDKLLSQIVVEQQDKRGDTVEYTKEDEETSKNRVEMQYTYTDLQIEKRITQIITTDKTTNTVKKHDIYQKANNIAKLDLPSKNIENTKLDIIYEIKVTNIGDYNATIDQIIDLLPNGANFSKEGNEGWYVGENGHIIYDNFQEYLRPNEEKVVKLKLTYHLDESGMAQIENDAYVLATKDIDEKIIIDEGNIKIEETNNYAKSELIVSIITGETILIYVTVILGGMLIVVAGISLIKKYIL